MSPTRTCKTLKPFLTSWIIWMMISIQGKNLAKLVSNWEQRYIGEEKGLWLIYLDIKFIVYCLPRELALFASMPTSLSSIWTGDAWVTNRNHNLASDCQNHYHTDIIRLKYHNQNYSYQAGKDSAVIWRLTISNIRNHLPSCNIHR